MLPKLNKFLIVLGVLIALCTVFLPSDSEFIERFGWAFVIVALLLIVLPILFGYKPDIT